MKRAAAFASLPLAALFAGKSLAADKPLFIYVSPNPLGVNDFLKLGKAGTEKVAEALGGEARRFESTDPTTQRQNLEAAAKAGAKIVISIGFEFNDMLPEVAAAYPKVKFLQVDSCPFDKMKPNIYCSVFREYEASYPDRSRGCADDEDRQGRRDQRARYPFPAPLHRRLHRGGEARQARRPDFPDPVGRRQ